MIHLKKASALTLFILGTCTLSESANAMSVPPCTPAMKAFRKITPLVPVAVAGGANMISGFALGFEEGPPATNSRQGWKVGVGLTATLVAWAGGFLAPACGNDVEGRTKQDINLENARAEWEDQKRTAYILGGINLGLGAAMLALAEHKTNRIVTAAGLATQLLVIYLYRDRFEYKEPVVEKETAATFNPICGVSNSAIQSCVSFRF